MKVQLINNELLKGLHERAAQNERRRIRVSDAECAGGGLHVPIHRHEDTDETVICIQGELDMIFFAELPNMDADGPVHDGECVMDERCFTETARFRVSPRERAVWDTNTGNDLAHDRGV